MAPRGTAVVEIGSFVGLSLAWLAAGVEDGGDNVLVHSVDLDDWCYRLEKGVDPHMTRQQNLKDLCLADNCFFHTGYSTDIAVRYDHLPISVLYIDASHEYADVIADVFAWHQHLTPHATIIFDDFNIDHPGVMRAVEDLQASRLIEITRYLSQGVVTCLG